MHIINSTLFTFDNCNFRYYQLNLSGKFCRFMNGLRFLLRYNNYKNIHAKIYIFEAKFLANYFNLIHLNSTMHNFIYREMMNLNKNREHFYKDISKILTS